MDFSTLIINECKSAIHWQSLKCILQLLVTVICTNALWIGLMPFESNFWQYSVFSWAKYLPINIKSGTFGYIFRQIMPFWHGYDTQYPALWYQYSPTWYAADTNIVGKFDKGWTWKIKFLCNIGDKSNSAVLYWPPNNCTL